MAIQLLIPTTIKSFKFAVSFKGISWMGSAFIFLWWFKLEYIYIQVTSLHTREEFESIRKLFIPTKSEITQWSMKTGCFNILPVKQKNNKIV